MGVLPSFSEVAVCIMAPTAAPAVAAAAALGSAVVVFVGSLGLAGSQTQALEYSPMKTMLEKRRPLRLHFCSQPFRPFGTWALPLNVVGQPDTTTASPSASTTFNMVLIAESLQAVGVRRRCDATGLRSRGGLRAVAPRAA